jgi:light-regulated signal transduction histidine kinase (bacteriophytochrome)
MLTLRNLSTLVKERDAIIEYSSELPVLQAHHSMITPLFQNLIVNGLKYNRSKQPKLKIWTSFQNGETVFAVQDNGIGIAKEQQSQLFEMFKRLHPQEFEGTGIGLASCKRVVEFYGGWIKIESAEGQGSTFYFTLPNALPKRTEMTYSAITTGASKSPREATAVGS